MKSATRRGLRVRVGGAVTSALIAVGASFAPGATAADVQSEQWYLAPMQAEKMWQASTGEGIKVAVIDTGVNPDTPSLKGQVLADEVPKQVAYGATEDYDGHGTTMAELIAGTGDKGGIQGLAPDAEIVPYRIVTGNSLDAEEEKRAPTPMEVVRAAADSDARIISMSFTSPAYEADFEKAVEYAASKGKLLVSGVGNEGRDSGYIGYPAAYPYVIGVSSIDKKSHVSDFAQSGNYVDLVAPGENMPGYCRPAFDQYCHDMTGTSSATAITSAAAALIWSAHPDWTANQVTRALIDTAGRKWPKDEPTSTAGYGTIRPRSVLADPNYDAGEPYSDPLRKENTQEGEKLVTEIPPTSASAKPSAGATAPSQGAAGSSKDKPAAAGSDDAKTAAADASSDSGSTLWIALGAAAAVVVIGGGAFAVLRARRAN
ncbi:S8 family serine peptidase [Streptomyces sp. RK23]|uniref:S8 family serine peptidase n=1 Tax=Streptomyces TaxID=1883 RepID=UPI001B362A5E|nr:MULTISPECIES: S8 family serine peptidase [unclassified Streptomyces]MBQ0969437.1 S8 family serine peptidase [Streptomyces sp. RK74B]MBQ1009198.1 S8 family serine peptidase [Streptomyces sp. RK23]